MAPLLSRLTRGLLLALLLPPGVLLAQSFDALAKKGQAQLSRTQTARDEGNTHVAAGTPVAKNAPFPLSGPH